MSYFPGLKLTKAGEQLLAKVNGNLNETINFKRAELGSGVINTDDEIRFLTMLKEKWKDVNISDCKIVGTDKTQVQIELQFDNAGISSNKIFRELGIYAAANDGEEILFAYSNAKENFDYIPVAIDNPQSFVINILITITSNTKVDAQIDLNSYVTLRKLQEELDKKLNKGEVSNEYNTAKKIEDKIKTKLDQGNVPACLNSAETIFKALQANTGIKFDENLLYLNDEGTKKAGFCYLDRLTDGIFECIQKTTTKVNDNAYFKNFSNKENSDRLSNLKIKLINDNQNYKLYENSTFYFIELKKGIKVENKVILNIPNFTLRGEQFLFSIPSTSTIGGPWGHNNLVCSVTDYNITIINEIDNTTNYTLNSMIIIPKL